MALPSSGPMRLGADVNVELGLSATAQISLGQASVRGLYGVASGAIRLAADGYGKSSSTPNFWQANDATTPFVGPVSYQNTTYNGDVYFQGRARGTNTPFAFFPNVTKITQPNGAPGWGFVIGPADWQTTTGNIWNQAGTAGSVTVSPLNGNSIINYSMQTVSGSVRYSVVAIIPPSGTGITFFSAINGTGVTAYGVCTDSSGNIYLGVGFSGTNYIAKYSPDGSTFLAGATTSIVPRFMCADSSGNLYVSDQTNLIKVNSTLSSILYQITYTPGGSVYNTVAMQVMPNGNLILSGYRTGDPIRRSMVVCLNPANGSIIWQKVFTITGGSPTSDQFPSVTVDSSNNIYVVGQGSLSAAFVSLLVKYNSSGNLLFARRFNGVVSGSNFCFAIGFGTNNMYVVTQMSSPSSRMFCFSLPSDGSKTGTYGDMTYQDFTTITDAAGNMAVTTIATYTLSSSSVPGRFSMTAPGVGAQTFIHSGTNASIP